MAHAVGHADRAQRPFGALPALGAPQAGVGERQLDVDERAGARDEVEALEDEADLAVAQVGEIVLVHLADVHAVDLIAAARWYVQAAEDVHQRALAAAGAAHDRHQVAGVDAQRDLAQRAHADLSEVEDLGDGVHLDDRMGRATAIASRRAPRSDPARATNGCSRGTRAGDRRARARGPAHQPPPLKNAPPPPPPPPRPPPSAPVPPPRRLPILEVRLLVLELVLLAAGSTTVSPAFRPLRTIVELLPASPVTTRWRTCLPARSTVTRVGGDRAGGDVDAFGLLDDDFGGRAHAQLQAGRELVELEGDVVADRAAAAGGEQGDFADVRRQLAAFERFDGHRGDLADLDVADFRFAQGHHQLHRAEVAEDGEGGAGGAGGARRAGRARRTGAGAARRGGRARAAGARSARARSAGGARATWWSRFPTPLRRPGRRARRSCRSQARRDWCPGPPVRRCARSACRS